MGRPHIEFTQSLEIEPARLAEGPFAGAQARLLSEDLDTGAHTATLSLPPRWSAAAGEGDRSLELFVLRGEIELDGARLSAGWYAHVPAGRGGELSCGERGADVLAMRNDPAPPSEDPIQITDTAELRWVASSLESVPPGLVNKRLRQDPATGERTWVAACPAEWVEERAEIHPTVEEALMLSGDLLLGDRGAMTPGCYFWRPPMVPHGPMYTRTGAQFFFRTRGGTLEVDYQSVPGWDGIVSRYRADAPLYEAWEESQAHLLGGSAR